MISLLSPTRMSKFKSFVRRPVKTVWSMVEDVKRPPWRPSGHYYSPIPSRSDIEWAIDHHQNPVAINMDEDEQRDLVAALGLSVPETGRWTPDNEMFGTADAAMLRAILMHYRPARFIEIGSGHSTALVLDLVQHALPELKITCVEPYADRLRQQLRAGDSDRLTLIETPVQQLDPARLAAEVGSGDIFFIDSTHIAKAGSDVCHLILHTLPLLPVGVLVHVHDIFWPFEYKAEWLRDGRSWNEAYLLQAFLTHNRDWKILVFNSWLWNNHPELVPIDTHDQEPGSIWLLRIS